MLNGTGIHRGPRVTTMTARTSAFVGRADLIARIAASTCRAQLLVGEPGIGKSRLLSVLRDVREREVGGVYVATRVHGRDTGASFEPLREIIASIDRDVRLGDDLAERVRRTEDRHLVRNVRDALAVAAAQQPLYVAFDDVFRLSPPGLEALAYLVDRLVDHPIHWYFAAHSERAVIDVFGPLVRANLLEVHEVEPLSILDSIALARSVAPTLEDARLREIATRCGGNPFFIETLAHGESAWHVATLRAAIAQRLDGFSDDERAVALLIATARGATPARIALAAGMSNAAVAGTCEELASRNLIVTSSDGALSFVHDLIAQSIVTSATERAREQSYERWLEFASDTPERIRCLEGAGRRNDVVALLVNEGWRCAERGHQDAVTYATQAHSFLGAGDARRFEISALHARYLCEAGEFDQARSRFAYFVAGRDDMEPSAFATAYGRFAMAAAPEFGGAGLPHLNDLLERAPLEFPAAYPALAHARALIAYCDGDLESARDELERAKAIPATPLEALRQDIWIAYLSFQIDSSQSAVAATALARAVNVALALDSSEEAARACFMCAFIAHRDDRLGEAEAWCRRGLTIEGPKPRSVVTALRTQLCEYLLLRGRAWEALGILLEATEETRSLRRDHRATVGAILALAQGLTGSLEAAVQTLDALDDTGLSLVIANSLEVIRGFLCELRVEPARAIRAYEAVIERATLAETSLAYAYTGRARIALGDRDAATLERLAASATLARARAPKSFSVNDVIAGFARVLAGDAAALAATVAALAQSRSAYDAAFSRLVLGECVNDVECLRSAATAFDAIGTQPLADRARAAARRNGVRLGAPRNRSRSLGERSRSVAIGIAAGQTNAEIAAALHLSPRTIEKHVSSLLRHFDVRSRVEIAGIILRGELGERS